MPTTAGGSAAERGIGRLIGLQGQYARDVMEVIEGKGIVFCPFVGEISGIPSVLHGSIDEIVAEALRTQEMGGTGIDLLAYRHRENSEELMERVIDASEIPVIVAGRSGSLERIRRVANAGASGSTVGTTVSAGTIVPSGSLEDQVLADVHETEGRKQREALHRRAFRHRLPIEIDRERKEWMHDDSVPAMSPTCSVRWLF